MNRAELIDAIIAGSKEKDVISRAQIERTVAAVFDTIKNTVANGGEVAIANFGTFKSNVKQATTARNIRTGEVINVPEKKVVKFVAGKNFKDVVAGN